MMVAVTSKSPVGKQYDPRLVRLINPSTGMYLHLSGRGEVKGTEHAWLGYRYQADTMSRYAMERGEDWPYLKEPR
jgi:hypothetical protein